MRTRPRMSLQDKYESLKSNYYSLNIKYDNLQENYITLNNKSGQFEHQLTLLKYLKVVSELQSVAKLQNRIQHLKLKLRNTKNKVSSLTNDVTSRKQYFIALLNKVQYTEQKADTLKVGPLYHFKMSKRQWVFQIQTPLKLWSSLSVKDPLYI